MKPEVGSQKSGVADDIVTKGHGGHLEVETEEGKGAEFKIILPVV